MAQPLSAVELAVADLVTVARFRDLSEAWIAKGMLESAGIPCFLADDNIIRMNWFLGEAIGGVRLQVSSEYVDSASQLLSEERNITQEDQS